MKLCDLLMEIMQIMVKTRGSGRTLSSVVGRGLGRGDGHDSDGAPQRRRPTASARRQRVPVTIANDVPAVLADSPTIPADSPAVPAAEPPVVGDEVMIDADAQDTGAEDDAHDTDADDATDDDEGFPGGPKDPSVLTGYADHVAASVWFGEERHELRLSSHGRKVRKLGKPIPAIEELVAGTGLSPLIACSVDTGDQGLISSFVERWHRETSSFHLLVGEPLHIDEVVLMLVELLMVSLEVAVAEIGQCCGPFLDALRDLTQTRRYAWGAVGLVHMYDHLNDASISTSRQVVGYITLLQCWIYEHFPSVAECNVDPDYGEAIPAPPVDSWVSLDDIDDRWMHYPDHLAPTCEMCVVPGQCALDYIDCFFCISHPLMIATQPSNPLPNAHAAQPRHVPQVPDDLARSNVDEPIHVVEACDVIAKRLERHLSLGVVTPDTSTHEVIEECLRIVRSVTEDRIVYVRSRCRRRMDQS
ncbi:Protein MAIN-LIKE 1 [Glycine max]|nr:Protein MAIN-LIKE 1 [Glycine max]